MSVLVTALSELSVPERSAVSGRIRREIAAALRQGPCREDDLISRVSAQTGRYITDVRFVLSSMDVAEDASGFISLPQRG